ncbi:WD40 repeat domain-containing serine/threonine protein kinase [Actinomadura livida]|uniref:Serine/threonine protein kinase n=2 Tax=Actinomadura TaxID=1988 RepID=A0A7W7IL18_9ACTN|nr:MULTISPECIES: serine/threonine-protein kinase [Actinomadura]MBB4778905.1 serine/threonine protein kinase [Actinomadura catellatispora]GGU26611.1 hypothetical protein GCM10010208_59270 [Actinomadura livida]
MPEDLGELLAGRYRLLTLIGRGGMGAVWRAWDSELGRTVAVKELRLPEHVGADERRVCYARMDREARAAGRLRHPGIITVHDRVSGEDGRPWIVMEFVEGGSLQDLLADEKRLPVGRVARIGAQMLAALRLAHRHGIVHRDVKPANVLLEGDRVVLTDFGIAALDGDVTLTRSGAIIGTPAFMAPEQVRGKAATPESDLWSLGATLFAAVEGGPPFTGTSPGSVFVAIATEDPAPCVHAGPLGEVLTGLLRKDPAERLTADRAEELLTALAAEPAPAPPTDDRAAAQPGPPPRPVPHVQTPPPGPPPQPAPPGNWAGPTRRGAPSPSARPSLPLLIGGLAAASALLLVTGAAVFWPDGGNAPAAETSGSGPASSPPAPPTPGPVSTGKAYRTLKTPDWARSVSFSPDGQALAAGLEGGSIRLWNMPGGDVDATMKVDARSVPLVAFRKNGKSLISGQWDGSVRLWNVASRSSSIIVPAPDGSGGIAVSPDGTMVARSEGKKIRLSDVAEKRTARVLSGHTESVGSVAFSQDGKLLASSSTLSDTVRIWDVASGRSLRDIPSEPLAIFADDLAFAPDGRTLAKSNDDNSIQLWDVARGKPTATLTNEEDDSYFALAFSPDGKTLAAGTGRNGIQLWDVPSARVTTILSGHESTVGGLAFSSDGRTLASASTDKTVRLWHVP